jgi:formate/nitrite transporter FocA (FNT family)
VRPVTWADVAAKLTCTGETTVAPGPLSTSVIVYGVALGKVEVPPRFVGATQVSVTSPDVEAGVATKLVGALGVPIVLAVTATEGGELMSGSMAVTVTLYVELGVSPVNV